MPAENPSQLLCQQIAKDGHSDEIKLEDIKSLYQKAKLNQCCVDDIFMIIYYEVFDYYREEYNPVITNYLIDRLDVGIQENNPYAILARAYLYMGALGAEKDYDKARALCANASEYDDVKKLAMVIFADTYANIPSYMPHVDPILNNDDICCKKDFDDIPEENLSIAEKFLRDAAKNKYTMALNKLGVIYYYREEYEEADDCFCKATDYGDSIALYNEAGINNVIRLMNPNAQLPEVNWRYTEELKNISENNIPRAMVELSSQMMRNNSNIPEANKIARYATQYNNANAICLAVKTSALYHGYVGLGDNAMNLRIRDQLIPLRERFLPLIAAFNEAIALSSNQLAWHELGLIYSSDTTGIKKDYEKAIDLYQQCLSKQYSQEIENNLKKTKRELDELNELIAVTENDFKDGVVNEKGNVTGNTLLMDIALIVNENNLLRSQLTLLKKIAHILLNEKHARRDIKNRNGAALSDLVLTDDAMWLYNRDIETNLRVFIKKYHDVYVKAKIICQSGKNVDNEIVKAFNKITDDLRFIMELVQAKEDFFCAAIYQELNDYISPSNSDDDKPEDLTLEEQNTLIEFSNEVEKFKDELGKELKISSEWNHNNKQPKQAKITTYFKPIPKEVKAQEPVKNPFVI